MHFTTTAQRLQGAYFANAKKVPQALRFAVRPACLLFRETVNTRAARQNGSGRSRLLDRNLRAGVLELLLDGVGLGLRDVFLDRLGGAFDQILGLLEAEVGQLAHHLDDADLLGRVADAVEDDGEL